MLRTLLLLALLPAVALAQSLNNEQMQTWRQLLHYDSSGRSAINSTDFFLSPNGQIDPNAELQATLSAMRATADKPNEHAQCRFVGRYIFLKQQGLLDGVASVTCPDFAEFTAHGHIRSVSLIFATGFLGNPASYYGHLLLRLNTQQGTGVPTDLEEKALNFGANIPPQDGMLAYIAKGLVGGYQSSFTNLQYFYHANNYGESELRDLWEYELSLPKPQMDLLIGHMWEIMNADFTYYFFNRNCAYRFGELLELVLQQPLTTPNRWWETPQAVVQRVATVQLNGKPIVSHVKFHPSRLSRLYQRYQELDAAAVEKIEQFVAQPAALSKAQLDTLPVDTQYQVIDTLLDYYQVVRKPKEGINDPRNDLYNKVLYQRYVLPPRSNDMEYTSDNNPQRGRPPSYVNLGLNDGSSKGYLRLWLRPAYYDNLDATYGHVAHSSLSMGEVELMTTPHESAISQLNIVKIDSIRTNLTGLPGDRHYSWYLDAGARQQTAGCFDCLAPQLSSGIGYAKSPFASNWVVAAFVGGGFHDSRLLAKGTYLSSRIQSSWYASDHWRFAAIAEHRWWQQGDTQSTYQLNTRYTLVEDMDLRFTYSYVNSHDVGISIGWYY